MAFQTPIAIKKAVENISSRKYLLPSIQRELVWSTEQIERLFDSLMRDYYIGSFLFWSVKKSRSNEYQFYEFIRNYHEIERSHNQKANINGNDDIIAVLNGQQRLTALYIGLKGNYAYKLPWKRWSNPSSYPERSLYLNLLKKSDDYDDDYDMEYAFKFLTKQEAECRDKETYWFRVGEILDLVEEFQVNGYLIQNELLSLDRKKSQFANKTLFKLHTVIHKNQIINYYEENDASLDKVLHELGRPNRFLVVDRFLDSQCQSCLS